jgi:hypothetical protein
MTKATSTCYWRQWRCEAATYTLGFMANRYSPIPDRDPRLGIYRAIMKKCASSDSDVMPDDEYEAIEELAAKAAGFHDAQEANVAEFFESSPLISLIAAN